MGRIYPICCLCGQPPQGGLYEGFYLYGKFICKKCEQSILDSGTMSLAGYRKLLSGIKRLKLFTWTKHIKNGKHPSLDEKSPSI